jgi:hypothetical protein
MSDKALRKALIRLASEKPELRGDLLPLLKEGGEAPKEKVAAYDDPADTAREFIMDGPRKWLEGLWGDLMRGWDKAEQMQKGLERAGAGRTEAVLVLNTHLRRPFTELAEQMTVIDEQLDDRVVKAR